MKSLKQLALILSLVFIPSLANANGNLFTLPNVATMKALGVSSAAYQSVATTSYTDGNIGGAIYDWNPNSTTSADNCFVIAATGVSTGRWILRLPLQNITQCGAKGDGSTEDYTAIQAVLTGLGTQGGGLAVVPSGTYKITGTLAIPTGISFVGTGWTSILDFKDSSATSNINLNGSNITLADFALQSTVSNASTGYGAITDNVDGANNRVIRHILFTMDGSSPGTSSPVVFNRGTSGSPNNDVYVINNKASGTRSMLVGGGTITTAMYHNVHFEGNTLDTLSDGININMPCNNTGPCTQTASGYFVTNNDISAQGNGTSSGIGIACAQCINAIIAHNKVRGAKLQGIHIEDGSQYITIDSNQVSGVASGEDGIYVENSPHGKITTNITVVNNELLDTTGLTARCIDYVSDSGGGSGTTHAQNTITMGNSCSGWGNGIQVPGNDIVSGNTVRGSPTATGMNILGVATEQIHNNNFEGFGPSTVAGCSTACVVNMSNGGIIGLVSINNSDPSVTILNCGSSSGFCGIHGVSSSVGWTGGGGASTTPIITAPLLYAGDWSLQTWVANSPTNATLTTGHMTISSAAITQVTATALSGMTANFNHGGASGGNVSYTSASPQDKLSVGNTYATGSTSMEAVLSLSGVYWN